ncbi:MAG: hypothetical protein COV76_06465 [Candidatus Omnitrophica bacterium CG11_big_fil_rev_8_21_14_0_20_64_10]|nr:MAG: hypothetical protein COV76_06465 [Candidatus Omnitrophica bacterium CG11_big_fil_rev_8_21_14_0_20_64_10]
MPLESRLFRMLLGAAAALALVHPARAAEGPGEVYLQYARTMLAADSIEALKPFVTTRNFNELTADLEEVPDPLHAFRDMILTRDPVIVDEQINGEEALLIAEGTGPMGRGRGEVRMVREEGTWRIDSETWKSGPKITLTTVPPAPEGTGTVRGTVSFPPGRSGRLYILLNRFGHTLPVRFTRVSIGETPITQTTFQFNEVEEGEWQLSAILDLEEPRIDLDAARQELEAYGWEVEKNLYMYLTARKGDLIAREPVRVLLRPGETLTFDLTCDRVADAMGL